MSADVAADADACWGSDGRIYFIDDRARLFAVSPQGVLTQLQRTDAPADAAHRYASPVVSPDGTRLAYLCDGKVRIRQLASGQEAEMEQDEWTTSVKILRWMKEDALLMQTRTEVTRETAPFQDTWYTLRINQTKKTYNGMIVTEMIVLGNIAPHLSPDGPYLLFTKDGSLTAMIMYGNIVPDFSPDGTTLVFTEDGSLYLKELAK